MNLQNLGDSSSKSGGNMMKISILLVTLLFSVNEAVAQTDDVKTGNDHKFKVTTEYDFRPDATPENQVQPSL